MKKGKRDKRIYSMDFVVCPQCGLHNDPIFSFCESCSTRLPKDDGCVREPGCFAKAGAEEERETHAKKKRKGDVLFWIMVVVALVGIGAWYFELPQQVVELVNNYQSQNEVEPDTPIIVEDDSTMKELDAGLVKVISSDWDWDSARRTDNGYEVDVILHVRNDNEDALTHMEFTVPVTEDPIEAVGYVQPGSKGIMVAKFQYARKCHRPRNENHVITSAMSNTTVRGYIVPCGAFIKRHGEDDNFYDISVKNENKTAAGQASLVVAVLFDGDDIKESDATGRLSGDIPADTSAFKQKDAFYDPHLRHYKTDKKKYNIYVIDENYLKNEEKAAQ